MKKYITKKRETKRFQRDCSGASRTDQSYKKAVDINNIIAKFQKTGVLPENSMGVYGDFSSIPTLEEAHEAIIKATEQFYALPAGVRKEMDNDPSKLELWLSNEANYDKALSYGLVEPKIVETTLGDVVDAINNNADSQSIEGGSNASTTNQNI